MARKMDWEQIEIVQSNPYVEALKEQIPFQALVHEGLSHAAVGLSGLLSRTVALASMQLEMMPVEEAARCLGDPETLVVGILLVGGSDGTSRFLLILTVETAHQLIDVALEQPLDTTQTLDELGYSVMGELGNMVVSYFLNRITQMTHTTALPSPPGVTVDMLGAVLDAILLPAGLLHERILLLNADFVVRDGGGPGDADAAFAFTFLLVPDLPDAAMADLEQTLNA